MNLMSSIAKTFVGSVIAIVSVAAERNDLIFLRGVGGNQFDDAWIDLELGQVDRRHAVLAAEQRRDLLVLHETERYEVVSELSPIRLLVVQRLLQLFRRNCFLLQGEFANAAGHGGGGGWV